MASQFFHKTVKNGKGRYVPTKKYYLQHDEKKKGFSTLNQADKTGQYGTILYYFLEESKK